jgi:hypothetical protein
MFGFIRSISFSVQAMIPVVGLIFFAVAWFFPGNLQTGAVLGNGLYYLPKDGWLYTVWTDMNRFPFWAQMVPSYLAAIATAIMLVRNDLDNLLMGRRSYAIAMVFLFLIASSGQFFLFHPAFLAGLMVVLSHRFLLNLYKMETEYSIVFMTGFTWGAAILLYPPILVLTPSILLGLLFMVSTNWRHWLVMVMGIAIPAVLAGACWFLIGDLDYEIQTFFGWFKIRQLALPAFIVKEPFLAAWLLLVIFWAVIASVRYRNPKIQSRQLLQANFLFFVLTVLTTVFFEKVSSEFVWLLCIPVSYLMTFWALEVRKGWVRDLFFITLLLSFAFFRVKGLA